MRTQTRKGKSGFTVIELLVVVAIIGLLSSIAAVALNSARIQGRESRRLSDLRTLVNALELYANDHGGQYPSTVSNGTMNFNGVHSSWWDSSASTADWIPGLVAGGYISKLPRDPSDTGTAIDSNYWQIQYLYLSDGRDYKLLVHNWSIAGYPNTTGDLTPAACKKIITKYPSLRDPQRTDGNNECWAYGISTPGAVGSQW